MSDVSSDNGAFVIERSW